MALVGISHHWGVCDAMVLWHFYQQQDLQALLIEKGRTSKPELYHTSQQLSQYEFPIRMFSHKHKYMYIEQTSCKLLSQKCHKHVTF